MIRDGKRVVILFLENWQKRMIKDFLGADCDSWEVPIEEGIKIMYGSPTVKTVDYKKMYLTDWQMKELRDEAGIICDFVELRKIDNVGAIYRYGLPPK
jgi:hypothetical protein